MSRLDRFKHLETRRAERSSEGDKNTQERFNRVEQERAPGEAPPPSPAAQRIQRQVSDQPLALDQRSTEEQQFTRCMHCEADNSRFAHACIYCGAPLQTDEQRDYNERFWRQRRSEAAREQQAVDQLRQHNEELTEEQARVQRETFSEMVKEAQGQARREGQPWGIRMINALTDPIWQWVLIGFFATAGLGAAAGLWYGRPDQLGLRWVCIGTLAALGLLFTPPGWWARRTRRGLFQDYDDWL
ncbi:MAG TPA: hypothetical protein VFA20_03235 [Myxococcaceae bacterium]|nr:hypothetical protein [Myxococcaceae bacterium]